MTAGRLKGRLFVVVGPSGAGKDTLLAGAKAADPTLHWARRVVTRPESPGGEPYEGVTEAAFEARLHAGWFALHWRAHGLAYGVPLDELAPLDQGRDVLLNGSRAALPVARAAYPDLTVIRVTAPPALLAERLAARGRETPAEIAARQRRASLETPDAAPAIEICNDATPQIGVERLLAALRAASPRPAPTDRHAAART